MPNATKPAYKRKDTSAPSKSRYLTTNNAAGYSNLSKAYLEKLRVTGGGPAFIKIGAKILYDVADLDGWLTSRKRLSTSEAGA